MSRPKNDIVYPSLEAEIARRGILKKDIAATLGITARTLSFKLSNWGKFTEAEKQVLSHQFEVSAEMLFGENKEMRPNTERISINVLLDGELICRTTVPKQ